MITQAFLQCPGIGPARLAALNAAGIHSWRDAIERPGEIRFAWRDAIADECRRCEEALAAADIAYLVERFHPTDKWRILAHYLDEATFFDIETTGLEYDAPISVIVCWHRQQLHTFVEHENLDDFLDLLDDVKLLTSFNGSSFDVPRILDAFHIPALPCPHLDLRWLCYHHGHRGGLKQIAHQLGIARPADLQDVDGDLAIHLWHRWLDDKDQAARDLLVRYCGADVLLTLMLAQSLVRSQSLVGSQSLAGSTSAAKPMADTDQLWSHLGEAPPEPAEPEHPLFPHRSRGPLPFGAASPVRLRGWRRVS